MTEQTPQPKKKDFSWLHEWSKTTYYLVAIVGALAAFVIWAGIDNFVLTHIEDLGRFGMFFLALCIMFGSAYFIRQWRHKYNYSSQMAFWLCAGNLIIYALIHGIPEDTLSPVFRSLFRSTLKVASLITLIAPFVVLLRMSRNIELGIGKSQTSHGPLTEREIYLLNAAKKLFVQLPDSDKNAINGDEDHRQREEID